MKQVLGVSEWRSRCCASFFLFFPFYAGMIRSNDKSAVALRIELRKEKQAIMYVRSRQA